MEDFTKFRLKSTDELDALLLKSDNIFVISCNKCFKEFTRIKEPEADGFTQYLQDHGKNILGKAEIDFLCNNTLTEKKMEGLIPDNAESVFVISCGLGVQTTARFTDIPVFAAANTLNFRGYHGMALTEKTCGACAQCFLNGTGGVCPVVDCAKGLLNGQCGGAKNGKCEVDSSKDCAWEKIYCRLEKQGRLNEFLNQPVQLRDYSKINYKKISEYVKSVREKRLDGYYGGVHPSERKEFSESIALIRAPEPEEVVIPLSQHAGAPAKPVVAVGETVKVGQIIGEPAAFISSSVHSSVSGVVTAIEPRLHPTKGEAVLSVVIHSDGKNVLHESVTPHSDLDSMTPDEIVEVVRQCGIVGMGGAGFPTAVKLKPGKPIDAVLLNGCECEPLLTADHRVMLEYSDSVIYGLRAMLKAVKAQKGIIVIEDNKPDALELLNSKLMEFDNLEVVPVKTKYPQGAEKMLIKRVMGRQVPRGGLPADVGVVVGNISTAKAISDAIQLGLPLIERVVTVTGEKIKRPGNYIVKIGTSVKSLLDICGGLNDESAIIKMGGPMMGFTLDNLNVPIIKGSNGIIAIEEQKSITNSCIKCGRCVDVCPMELSPLYFAKLADEGNWQGMLEKNVRDCIECRCCEYICSSKIPLVQKIKTGKRAIMEMK